MVGEKRDKEQEKKKNTFTPNDAYLNFLSVDFQHWQPGVLRLLNELILLS